MADSIILNTIYTFHPDDMEQDIEDVSVSLLDGELHEGMVLACLLSNLEPRKRFHLCKISLCVKVPEGGDINVIAPWLFNRKSPLYGGKLWLKQHIYSPEPLREPERCIG